MLRVAAAGRTDRGRVRTQNEDRWHADPLLGLFLVADGMGGRFAGALAAQKVVDRLPALVQASLAGVEVPSARATERLSEVLTELSEQVRQESEGQPGLEGMGATVVLALVRQAWSLIAHLGDSRAYLLRAGCLEQLTKDHTIVQLLLEIGEISQEEAPHHPARSQVTRYVGMPGEVLPDVQTVELCPGDRLLLCSDGLTGMVDDAAILAILQKKRVPATLCRHLVLAANAAGGIDNITAVVVAVEEPQVRSP
jgi:protein phosphatase